MKLIVGLGNPEKQYDNTYHNLGFFAIDNLANKLNVSFSKKMCDSIVGEIKINNEKVFLIKPLTYMNRSGIAIRQMIQKFKIDIKDVYVFVDDIDLPLGKIRYRESGSAGTHNGLRSIVEHTGMTEFKRVKIGVGRDEKFADLADFVVSKIPGEKMDIIKNEVNEAVDLMLSQLYK